MVLILPFGVVSGYTMVTLAYQLKAAGVKVEPIAALAALAILPQTWKFLWAPVVDVTLDQRQWYLISTVLTSIGLAAMGCFPPTQAGLRALSVVVFMTSLASTFSAMACDSLIAHATPDELRGKAGGWYQAGNLGAAGLGGGIGLELAQGLPHAWMASTIVAGLCLLCCVFVIWTPPPEKAFERGTVSTKLRKTAGELWQLVRSRTGALALILCFLPLGSGAAPFAAMATEWRASARTVAVVTGVLGGVVAAVGSIAGGWICDRVNRQGAYVWFGLIQAAAGLAMAVTARSPWMYVTWTLAYTFASGLAYAAFSAFALEAIGKGAAATKYNVLVSLSNVPFYYLTRLDGWSHDKWDSARMFYLESGLAGLSAVLFLLLARFLWPARRLAGAKKGALAS
jgi:MFS family permease